MDLALFLQQLLSTQEAGIPPGDGHRTWQPSSLKQKFSLINFVLLIYSLKMIPGKRGFKRFGLFIRMFFESNWTKCLKNQPCDVMKMREMRGIILLGFS